MATLLDTHAWLWWLNDPASLSSTAREAVEAARARGQLYVSSISVWEVALLVSRGRLSLSLDVAEWLRYVESLPFLSFMPVNNAIALKSVQLEPPLHQDPADRIIIATALLLGATLVTKDEKILAYRYVKALW